MGIDTDFGFDHFVQDGTVQVRARALVVPGSGAAVAPVDLLGPLRGFVGNTTKRTWSGTGFNMIWRPNFGGKSGNKDFFLELNRTKEILDFSDITGTGVANRGFFQQDVALGAIAYLQQVSDTFDNSHQHFEPGLWVNIPSTTNPAESNSIARMGSIPHGSTINLQGSGLQSPAPAHAPDISSSSITPFAEGSPDDGATNLVHFDEEDFDKPSTSRTPLNQVAGLDKAHLSDPNKFLTDISSKQQFLGTTVLIIQSLTAAAADPSHRPPIDKATVPDAGGGIDNIAFLQGPSATAVPTRGNAFVQSATAIFWIERVIGPNNKEFMQLQYTQRVLLNFNGLSWPHVSVATLI
jgi:hypothetical protein